MRVSVRLSWLAVLGVAALPLMCSFPTDKSDEVFVVVVPSDSLAAHGILDRGGRDQVFARAYHRLTNGDSVQLTNIAFTWFSTDKNIASVEGGAEGSAEVTGVNPGFAQITARAVPFEKALDGAATVRVADRFVIDSIRPLTIHYGDKLRFYGVRIQQLFGVSQGFGSLIPDFFSYNGSLEGVGYIDYWVPFPSTSAHPFYIGPGFFGNAQDSITVDSTDLYEPNYALPTQIDINGNGGPRTFSGFPVLYFNPALDYEQYNPVTDGPFAVDWYRFARTDTTQAVTYILNSQVFDDTAFAYFTDSAYFNGSFYSSIGISRWLESPGNGQYFCDNDQFFPNRDSRTSSAILALKTLPAKQMHLLSNYGKPGAYSLIVVRGYFTVDRRIGPDRFEENDNWCQYANANYNDSVGPSARRIVLGIFGSFNDSTLTIDNPNDADWYKFRVGVDAFFPQDTLVTIHAKARPFSAVDASDIDLYVYDSATFTQRASSTSVGSTEALTFRVVPGVSYFLGVIDAAAEPTRYSICMQRGGSGVTCTPQGSAAAASIAQSAYLIRTRPPGIPPGAERIMRARLDKRP
jgi:hypothetical protein